MPHMNTLVCNTGSSSLRLVVFDARLRVLKLACAQRLGTPAAVLQFGDDASISHPGLVAERALEMVLILLGENGIPLDQTVHRMIHGGAEAMPVSPLGAQGRASLDVLIPLAPLHHPTQLAVLDVCLECLPRAAHFVLFDSSLFDDLPISAQQVGLPRSLTNDHLYRRFGFHGFSHLHAAGQAALQLQTPVENLRLITCHLGGGCSATAWSGGEVVETTMGYSPLEGMLMSTRSGDLDPNLVLDLVTRFDGDVAHVRHLLHAECGLLGRGGSADLRDLVLMANQGDLDAAEALDLFVHRVQRGIASLLPACGARLDALVFTGGIGEHQAGLRQQICHGFRLLGLQLDGSANEEHQPIISTDRSAVDVLVIPSDEARCMMNALTESL